MNFSLGGVKRGFLAFAAVLLLSVSLFACAGDDKPSAPKTTATADPKAADEAAVRDVYDRFWDASIKAESLADPDAKRFEGLFDGPYLEGYLKVISDNKANKIVRVGKPTITDIEVSITGDNAAVLACINEDEWGVKHQGKVIPPPKEGPKGTAAKATRSEKGWILTDLADPPKGEKSC